MNSIFTSEFISECPSPFQASLLQPDLFLPLVITPNQDSVTFAFLLNWLNTNKNWLEQALLKYGGILFRAFPIADADNFESVINSFGNKMLSYTQGNSPRSKVHNQVYISTEFPAHHLIGLHNELAYTNHPPRKAFFFCQYPSPEGGETPIVDSRRIYQILDPAIRDRLLEKKVCYVQNMPNNRDFGVLGKSWQAQFETSDREVVESHLQAENIQFHWKEDGTLHTRLIGAAAIAHPETGEMAWHSQAHTLHYSSFGTALQAMRRLVGEENLPINTYYGDGSPLDPADVQAMSDLHLNESTQFAWQKGDLLMLDNLLTAHGRKPFTGERRILVGMTN
jgi:alpha-ketoglutarate-dependent taurine dioxygenase